MPFLFRSAFYSTWFLLLQCHHPDCSRLLYNKAISLNYLTRLFTHIFQKRKNVCIILQVLTSKFLYYVSMSEDTSHLLYNYPLMLRILQIDPLDMYHPDQQAATSLGNLWWLPPMLRPALRLLTIRPYLLMYFFCKKKRETIRSPILLLQSICSRGSLQFYLLIGENIDAAHVFTKPFQKRLRARIIAYFGQDLGRDSRRQVRTQPAKLVVEQFTGDTHLPLSHTSLSLDTPFRFPQKFLVVFHITSKRPI